MPKPDRARRRTDKQLAALEQRIAAVYKQAADEMQGKVDAYFQSFAKRDAEQKALIGTIVNGKEYTEQDYKQWRLAQIGRGERMEKLRDQLAERMTKANEVAAAYINDATPGIYSLNRNYAAYTIEQVAGDVGFTMWDEQTVKRLIKEQPDLMPYYPEKRAVKRGIDLKWGKQQITAQVTTGILQGESIKNLADRLQTNVPNMNRDSAIRAARTAVTGAQNAGRMDSYDAAKGMGIKLRKVWLATLDGRTRHAHAMLDGQTAETDKPFHSELGDIMFPGDQAAEPANIYNCRCTMIAGVDGVYTSDAKRWSRSLETNEREIVKDMTYAEWAGWKQQFSSYKDMPQGYRRQFMAQPSQTPDIYRYTPAKSAADAEEYISSISKTGSVQVGKDVTLEQLNAVSMSLTDIYNRYGVKLDVKAIKHTSERVQAAYSSQNHTLYIKGNLSSWAKNAEKNYATNWIASGDQYQVVFHELGHAFWDEMPKEAKGQVETLYNQFKHDAYKRWMDMGGSRSGKSQAEIFGQYLSRYGQQDKYEFFSECFAQIMTDYEGEAAFDVENILDEFFKR